MHYLRPSRAEWGRVGPSGAGWGWVGSKSTWGRVGRIEWGRVEWGLGLGSIGMQLLEVRL